jgi:hypothetical protein
MIQRCKNSARNGDSGLLCLKNFKTQKSSRKVFISVFWDRDGILLIDYLEKGATITQSTTLHFSTN